jgi:hypothetical protein
MGLAEVVQHGIVWSKLVGGLEFLECLVKLTAVVQFHSSVKMYPCVVERVRLGSYARRG